MNATDKCHLMIDMETYGVGPNAVFRTIAGVLFNFEGKEPEAMFHYGVDLEDALMNGLVVDQETINFWRNQSEENRNKLLDMSKYRLKYVLEEIETGMKKLDNVAELCIWSHGSNFDIVILENAYKAIGKKAWWKYSKVRDTRTLFDIAGYEYKALGVHDALDDAMYQAKAVQEAYRQLIGRKESVKDLTNKVQYLLRNYISNADGKFCFPDGDIWDIDYSTIYERR